eukprot:jgi/Botrbrau1/12174/Bobra.0186s0082.1
MEETTHLSSDGLEGGDGRGVRLSYKLCKKVFAALPLAALVAGATLVLHGGLFRKRKRKACPMCSKPTPHPPSPFSIRITSHLMMGHFQPISSGCQAIRTSIQGIRSSIKGIRSSIHGIRPSIHGILSSIQGNQWDTGSKGGPLKLGSLEDLRKSGKGGVDPMGMGSTTVPADVLWSDPIRCPGFSSNTLRGVGTIFGPDITQVSPSPSP